MICVLVLLSFVSFSCVFLYIFFFFKQKTAYEMRISDWSSDVCSSDLTPATVAGVVSHDPGLAARVLALANSSQFGLTRRVTELSQAITIVGTGVVQTLALASAAALVDTDGIIEGAHEPVARDALAPRLLAPTAWVQPDDADRHSVVAGKRESGRGGCGWW